MRSRPLPAHTFPLGTVRTKFCDRCAAVVTNWLEGEDTIESPPEDTLTVAINEPSTPAQNEQVTQSLAERELASTVEKYRIRKARSSLHRSL
jgi:hypothetical protein